MRKKLFVAPFAIACAASAAIEKRAALVVDFASKRIVHESKMNAKRHPASLTKIMTIYLIFEAIRKGKISFSTKFTVSRLAAAQMPSKVNLKPGEKISVLDLVKAIIVQSANDAAVVAAEGLAGSVGAFCSMMNKKAIALGMKNTYFENPSGVPNRRQITTARDMMTLGIAVFRDFPEFWHFFSLKSFKYKKNTYRAHCKMLNWYNGVDGGKTGYTCASGFNIFVTANRYSKTGEPKRIFAVVMGGDSGKARDLYAAALMNKHFARHTVCKTKSSGMSHESLGKLIPIPTDEAPGKQLQTRQKQKKIKKEMQATPVVPAPAKEQPKEAEIVIQEDKAVSVSEILAAERVSQKYIDELYAHDEDVVQIEEEIPVPQAQMPCAPAEPRLVRAKSMPTPIEDARNELPP